MTSPRLGPGMLTTTACGTAIASVSALGLFQIERLVGGIWSLCAVAVAGLICWGVARAFARLCAVVPSGAGLVAYLARGFGRQAGMALALPYLLLTLLLVGVEALVVGTMVGRLTGLHPLAGALALVAGTYVVCRAGLRVGYRAQAAATGLLVAGMAALSLLVLLGHVPSDGTVTLLRPPPGAARFAAAVGQALFLFMGFELVTTQVEVARAPAPVAVGRALSGSVGALGAFYGLVALGFAALPTVAAADPLVPQLEMARAAGGPPAVAACVAVCVLASFTSLNGALLALCRFIYALAMQGVLPRKLAVLEGRRLVPTRALALLAIVAAVSTVAIAASAQVAPVILAAAASAALAYAAALLARQRAPFVEANRSPVRRAAGVALAAVLAALGVAVLASAGAARLPATALAGVVALLSWLAARRATRARPAAARAPVPEVRRAA